VACGHAVHDAGPDASAQLKLYELACKLCFMRLDPGRLRVLREVALRGTVTAAADALGYTPSAISQQLSALERESGVELLERNGRRLRLTEAGRLLVERTEPVLTALEEARAALEAWQTTVAGELRVAASGSVAGALVIPVAAELMRRHPQLRVTVGEAEPDQSVVALRLGELDLVVAHEYDHEPLPADEHVVRVELFAEELALAAPTGRFPSPVGLAELAGEVWVAEPPRSSCGRALRSACRAAGFEPDVRYTSSETSVVLATVASAGAVSLVPRLGLATRPASVDIVAVREAPPRRVVFAAHRPANPVRPSVARMLELLRAAVPVSASDGGTAGLPGPRRPGSTSRSRPASSASGTAG
jgi:DNA-binding transcriptional LysR family regulator